MTSRMRSNLFVIVIDWLMREMTSARDTGVEYVEGEILEDLDYMDDFALVSEGVDDLKKKYLGLSGAYEKDSDNVLELS